MSYTLAYSVKPGRKSSVGVYEPNPNSPSYFKTLRSCSKLIDAIFAKGKPAQSKRLHIKGKHYMYIPSDEYKLVRVKFFK